MVDFSPIIAHVDMDAFFAAVEIRNNPKLKGLPVMVGGGVGQRGVVSTCSYEARKYGVHSGMSTVKAKRLCPHGVFISAGLGGYVYASACLQKIFEKYTPIVEPCSVDEAFLDITGAYRPYGGPVELVLAMKQEIAEKLHLTCSVGISPSKYLAKMASGLNKPNGLTVMDQKKFKEVFYPRPVKELWGIGESTSRTLAGEGILTVGELAAARPEFLKRLFGINGYGLSDMSRGIDDSPLLRYREMPNDKSMSHETTLREDIQDPSMIRGTILWLSDKVARRMRRGGYLGRTVSVKVRSSDFKTITRSHTITRPTDRCDVLFKTALGLVPKEYGMKIKVRLLGVRMSHLERVSSGDEEDDRDFRPIQGNECGGQLELITDVHEQHIRELTQAVDAIRDKYGEQSIKLAGTLRSP